MRRRDLPRQNNLCLPIRDVLKYRYIFLKTERERSVIMPMINKMAKKPNIMIIKSVLFPEDHISRDSTSSPKALKTDTTMVAISPEAKPTLYREKPL